MVHSAPALVLTGPKGLVLVLVGMAAGVFNGIAGGGTLLTFPALLALGVPALNANITSAVGIVPSYLGGVAGFRSELAGQWPKVRSLLPTTLCGGTAGAILLLTTSPESFRSIVPWLVGFATVLFAVQPVLVRALSSLHETHPTRRMLLQVGTAAIAVYGGYFGAGMGVMMLAVFGITMTESLLRINGLRTVLSIVLSALVALIFITSGNVLWAAAGCLAVGTLFGGWAGASVARWLPPPALRAVVVVVGTATTVSLVIR